ncbi:hypothetical protein [Actinoplanes sp. NPDC049681]
MNAAADPRARYVITPATKILVRSRRLFGSRLFDTDLRQQFRAA